MSFSSNSKQDLCRIIPNKHCCRIAELSALIRTTGVIKHEDEKTCLKLNIENARIARKIFLILKKLFNISVELSVKKNSHFNKHNTYNLIITENMKLKDILFKVKILKEIGSAIEFVEGIDESLIKNQCCMKSYLRGAFLGSASISNPEKTYHLEFVVDSKVFAQDLLDLLNNQGLNAKMTIRKNNYILYLKEGEHIIDLLNIIGAHSSLLALENIRVFKEIRNNVNRVVNCETANLKKTVDASVRQIENIKLIDSLIGINRLPEKLRDIARVRLDYADATLSELSGMINPPISKSGVNHRLRKLEEIAEGLREREGING